MRNINDRYQGLITFAARLILGGVLVVAGGLKAFSPSESASAVAAYKILPNQMAHILGYALPWLEIAIGLLLIIGVSVRFCRRRWGRRADLRWLDPGCAGQPDRAG